ncbi:hypothetical protein HAX54_046927, partial [Datura stramonium]|nr:hypothetical protein [Datura stramonium]
MRVKGRSGCCKGRTGKRVLGCWCAAAVAGCRRELWREEKGLRLSAVVFRLVDGREG